jgi:hypothetical protein
LLNAALKAAEADVDKWSSLIFPSQKQKWWKYIKKMNSTPFVAQA